MKTSKNQNTITPAALSAFMGGDMENFVAAATPGGIEAQEKRGQIEQSFAETLPVDGTSTEEQRKQFEALGFVFALDRTAAQNRGREAIFVDVKFPTGWRKQATDHSMWSNLLDEQGRKRGMIFYKAAFYDRSAAISLNHRISVKTLMLDEKQEEIFDRNTGGYAKGKERAENEFDLHVVIDNADDQVLFKATPTLRPDWSNRTQAEKRQQADDEQRQLCVEWITTNKPDYKSPLAYWNDAKATGGAR